MTNVHYLRKQLTMAADCIRRGLDALEGDSPQTEEDRSPSRDDLRAALAADGAQELPTAALPQQARPSPRYANKLGQLEDRVSRIDGGLDALAARVEQLAKILLDIAPDACARHDLFGF